MLQTVHSLTCWAGGQQAVLQLPQPHIHKLQLLQLVQLLLQARLLLIVLDVHKRFEYEVVLRTSQTLSSAICWWGAFLCSLMWSIEEPGHLHRYRARNI